MGKFQPRQALFAGKVRQLCQRNAGLRHQAARFLTCLQAAEARSRNHQTVQSPVRDQKVCAAAKHQGPGPALPGHGQQQHQLLPLLREGHPPRRSPHPEGGVLRHRLLFPYLYVRQVILHLFVKPRHPIHARASLF